MSATTIDKPRHPATFSTQIIKCMAESIEELTRPPRVVLDPFAGIGKIHQLHDHLQRVITIGVELESEWAEQAPRGEYMRTICGDALANMRCFTAMKMRVDAIATSPCYGNRMADKHTAGDKCSLCKGSGERRVGRKLVVCTPCTKCKGTGLSPRRSYRHDLGRLPSDGSAAIMQWGPEYRAFHGEALQLMHDTLRRRGVLALNIKDHVRGGKLQRVPQWWRRTAIASGFEIDHTWTIPQNGNRHGANHAARASNELVYVFRRR